ncbi:MAG: hypothetical protein HKN78_07015 [Sphingomonadaceae bacterium]|nr:hypothetical protein [Sphingomonadaceae bacterium]
MNIETKMDPLAASFAAMEEPAHEESEAEPAPAPEPPKTPIEKMGDQLSAMKSWMDAHTVAAAPQLLIAAAGHLPGWRHASLELSSDGGASFESIGQTAPPAIIGTAVDTLADGQSTLFDAAHAVEIELLHGTMWLEGRNDDGLVAGANLALLGDELIQFGAAEALGVDRFRLLRLLRGRRGTESAMSNHVAGERFVLLDPLTLKPFDAASAMLGAELELLATGIGDDIPAEAALTLAGRSIRPPAPQPARLGVDRWWRCPARRGGGTLVGDDHARCRNGANRRNRSGGLSLHRSSAGCGRRG